MVPAGLLLSKRIFAIRFATRLKKQAACDSKNRGGRYGFLEDKSVLSGLRRFFFRRSGSNQYTCHHQSRSEISLCGECFLQEEEREQCGKQRLKGKEKTGVFRGRIFLCHRLCDESECAADQGKAENRHPLGRSSRKRRCLKKHGADQAVKSGKSELPDAKKKSVFFLRKISGKQNVESIDNGTDQSEHIAAVQCH